MATWSKLFTNFAWKNRPDTSTPLGQTLLNRLNNAINGIDDRVVTLNAEKASTEDLNGSIVNVRLDEKTGIFTFTRFDGTTFTINTALEEVVTNFVYDYATQSLVLTLADGTTQNIDLSALITQYEFTSSATILFTVGNDGKVTANIKPNSISDQMLQTNYLADITTQANTAASASQSALESQSLAEQSAEDADAQADRAKAEADRAEEAADRAEAITGFTVDTNLDKNSSNPIANKAVAEEFGKYLRNTGGTISDKNAVPLIVSNTTEGATQVRIAMQAGDTNLGFFAFDGVDIPVAVLTGGFIKKLLHESNFSDYAVPLNGGGTVQKASWNPMSIKNTASDTVHMGFSGLNGTQGYLGFAGGKPSYCKSDGNTLYELLHTGNKPTGTYIGNGDATARTINIGGINGGVLVVRNSNYSTLVLDSGAISIDGNGTITGIPYKEAHYTNNVLTLATTNVALNQNGTTNTYYSP